MIHAKLRPISGCHYSHTNNNALQIESFAHVLWLRSYFGGKSLVNYDDLSLFLLLRLSFMFQNKCANAGVLSKCIYASVSSNLMIHLSSFV